jgi:hypothetical protein
LSHPRVPHPREFLKAEATQLQFINDWTARALTRTLGSMSLFWVCFLVPLIAIATGGWFAGFVAIVFSYWLQAWALPVLQLSQNRAERMRDAKIEADHQALEALLRASDANTALLRALADRFLVTLPGPTPPEVSPRA